MMSVVPVRLGALAALAMLLLSACITLGPNREDPYEDFNRQMFAFNDNVDRTVFEPAAKGYRALTNEPVRQGLANFVNNLGEPLTFTNELLQGKLPQAVGAVGRFVINSTLGIAGVFDPAGSMGIERTDEDFGQTLGLWGFEPGPYLVLPFLGSTSPRDLIGLGGDLAIDPINYVEFASDTEARIGLAMVATLGAREQAIATVESVRSQIDPYTTARRFYVRNRAALIGSSLPAAEEPEKVPDFELDF